MANNNKRELKLKIKIVKMVAKDVGVLFKLGKAHWKNETWLTKNYLKASFDQAGISYIAKSEEKTIGGAIFVYQDIVENWLRYLIVDKKYRRQSVGTALLQKIFDKIKKGDSVFVDTGVSDKKPLLSMKNWASKIAAWLKVFTATSLLIFLKKQSNKNYE